MKTKVYIAFSIHGTNNFTVVTNTLDVAKLPAGFTIARSRRPNYDAKKDGVKLNWSELNKADGTPHTNPSWVARRMNQLARMGWTVVRDKKTGVGITKK